MSGYTLTRSSECDIREIWSHVAVDDLNAADRLLGRFYERFRLLGDNPHLGPLHPELAERIRCTAVGFYVVLYKVTDDRVVILRVLHGRRDIPSLLENESLDGEDAD